MTRHNRKNISILLDIRDYEKLCQIAEGECRTVSGQCRVWLRRCICEYESRKAQKEELEISSSS